MTFTFHLLLLFLMLYLARLCLLDWDHTCPAQLRTATRNTASNVFSSHAPLTIVQPVASPHPSRRLWVQRLRQ